MERDRVGIGPLVGEAIELLSNIAEGKNVQLRAAIDPDVPAIYADRERILQAISNLVGNAVKFTPAGGEVLIEAHGQEEYVVLSVVDTGSGIADSDLPHVFYRYWQVKSRRRGRPGIGLRLVIVNGIDQAHGGKIWAESELAHGQPLQLQRPGLVGPVPAARGVASRSRSPSFTRGHSFASML